LGQEKSFRLYSTHREHQFSVHQEGNFYTAEVWGGRPQKFIPRKDADPALLVGHPVRSAWTK
jgi:hypothetical protein